MAVDIAQLLAFAVKNNASDLHLSSGVPPMIRVDGDMKRINMPPLSHQGSALHGVRHHERQAAQGLRGVLETDFSFEIPKLARFRVQCFNRTAARAQCSGNIPRDPVAR